MASMVRFKSEFVLASRVWHINPKGPGILEEDRDGEGKGGGRWVWVWELEGGEEGGGESQTFRVFFGRPRIINIIGYGNLIPSLDLPKKSIRGGFLTSLVL